MTKFLLLLPLLISPISTISFSNENKVKYDEAVLVSKLSLDNLATKATCAYIPEDENYKDQKTKTFNALGNIEPVWDSYKGEGIRVAVIDTGIDYNHPDFYDDDGNCCIDIENGRFYAHVTGDSSSGYQLGVNTDPVLYFSTNKSYKINGSTVSGADVVSHFPELPSNKYHGTSVAGVIAAQNNQTKKTGIVGIAPKATIVPIKTDLFTDSIGYAMQYVASLNEDANPDNDIDIVNISLVAYEDPGNIMKTGANNLESKGIITIAAAGNDSKTDATYPAAFPNVIGVGALSGNKIASYSNTNKTGNTSSSKDNNVDIVAPGEVYTADYPKTYKNTHGTSFASPVVAGLAALWKEANPTKTLSQFKDELHTSCNDLGDSGWDTTYGYGAINVNKLLNIADPLEELYDAIDFAEIFLEAITCDATGQNSPLFETDSWEELSQYFNELLEDKDRAFFKNATYEYSGSKIEATNGTNQTIAECCARYDLIVSKYGYENFMSRNIQQNVNSTVILNNDKIGSTSIALIVVTCLISCCSIALFLFLKKKNLN